MIKRAFGNETMCRSIIYMNGTGGILGVANPSTMTPVLVRPSISRNVETVAKVREAL